MSPSCYVRIALLGALLSAASGTAAAHPLLRSKKQPPKPAGSSKHDRNTVLRWAASGGGWRAMTSHMAFANVWAQAGLLGPDSDASQFDAISSNSGGSWFTTQLFYSQQFYQSVVGSSAGLQRAIEGWMDAYLSMQSALNGTDIECDLLADLGPELQLEAGACTVLASFGGSWADFIEAMLGAAAASYGDAAAVNRTVGSNGRLQALGATDLLVQMTLTAASVSNNGSSLSYLSPGGTALGGSVYSVPLAVLHAVKANQTGYQYGVPPDALPLSVQWSEAPEVLVIDEWIPYFLYPGTHGTALTKPLRHSTGLAPLSPLFGGVIPTVAQVAAASSAAAGGFSGLSPATVVQTLSLLKAFTNSTERDAELDTLGAILYANSLTDGLAMCNQWPNDCVGPADGVLIDGGYIDNNALAMNIGNYQSQSGADLTATLKLIVTVANLPDDLGSDLLFASYFSCDANEGVAPGDFVWPVQAGTSGTEEDFVYASPNPVLSLQIFQESMSLSQLASLRVPIAGTNLTSAVVQATTVDNPAYGTVAGQRVDILYLETHVDIPTIIVGVNTTETWAPVIVSAAMDIAEVGAPVLIQRVHEFLAL